MNKWIFRIAAVILFLDVWLFSAAGLIYITRESNIDIHPLLVLFFEIISIFSFLYYDKYRNKYCETTYRPTTEEITRDIQYKDMIIDHAPEIVNKLHWYSGVLQRPLSDFSDEDFSKVEGLASFAEKELSDFAKFLPDIVHKQHR